MVQEEKTSVFMNGVALGFAVGSIIWCTSWAYILGKLDDTHKNEVNYLIELHQKEVKSEN